jgi:hypothetical protein
MCRVNAAKYTLYCAFALSVLANTLLGGACLFFGVIGISGHLADVSYYSNLRIGILLLALGGMFLAHVLVILATRPRTALVAGVLVADLLMLAYGAAIAVLAGATATVGDVLVPISLAVLNAVVIILKVANSKSCRSAW